MNETGFWNRIPLIARAIVSGALVGLVAANIWPILLAKLDVPLAGGTEMAFLLAYIWRARGGGPPRSWKAARAARFRTRELTGADWRWGVLAAISFAATVHAAIVLLFRLVPFPTEVFHQGYDLSFIPDRGLQLLVCVVSAASAGICEETGFRGYMQTPIESRHGAFVAIVTSSLLFMLVHLTKSWSQIGMVPIVFGAGVMLGLLAWASRSLVFCMIGHTIMDIGLFAYWWTQIAGTFSQRPLSETGMDRAFQVECGVFVATLLVTLVAIIRLRQLKAA